MMINQGITHPFLIIGGPDSVIENIIKNFAYYIDFVSIEYHLLVESNHPCAVSLSEIINLSNPSINVTFEWTSDIYKENLFILLLYSANADGTADRVYTSEISCSRSKIDTDSQSTRSKKHNYLKSRLLYKKDLTHYFYN